MENQIFQFIGSFASIASIPLAIFLYLRSQQQKYLEVRRQIVKSLSHQIGEGRPLSLFEVNAVRDSNTRDAKVRGDLITADSLIEDLISETLSSPLLTKERKQECIKNLENVHSKAILFQSFEKHVENTEIKNEDISALLERLSKSDEKVSSKPDSIELFAKTAITIAALLAIAPIPSDLSEADAFTQARHETLWINIALGLSVVTLAFIITLVRNKFFIKNR